MDGSSIDSRSMYCQMSSSVQSDRGKALRCSPGWTWPGVELPQLGPLALGIPLAEGVPEGEHPLFGPGLVLVPPGAADAGVESVRIDGVEQRGGLEAVSHAAVAGIYHPTGVDRVLHGGDQQPLAQLLDATIAEVDDFGEVVAGVDMHDREREVSGPERLFGQPEQHRRVLAPAEQEHRALTFGGHFPHDEDGMGLQQVEMVDRRPGGSPRAATRDPEVGGSRVVVMVGIVPVPGQWRLA